MVKHIVMWQFKEGMTIKEQREYSVKLKEEIEALQAVVPGVEELKVVIDSLETSNRHIMLESTFISAQALADYQVHPAHVAVAQLVGSVTCNRACMDYELI